MFQVHGLLACFLDERRLMVQARTVKEDSHRSCRNIQPSGDHTCKSDHACRVHTSCSMNTQVGPVKHRSTSPQASLLDLNTLASSEQDSTPKPKLLCPTESHHSIDQCIHFLWSPTIPGHFNSRKRAAYRSQWKPKRTHGICRGNPFFWVTVIAIRSIFASPSAHKVSTFRLIRSLGKTLNWCS